MYLACNAFPVFVPETDLSAKVGSEVKKQIDFLIDRDTQTEIMVEKTDGTIQDLAVSINQSSEKIS